MGVAIEITIFEEIDDEFIGINQPFPVMAGKHGIVLQNPRDRDFTKKDMNMNGGFLLADGC